MKAHDDDCSRRVGFGSLAKVAMAASCVLLVTGCMQSNSTGGEQNAGPDAYVYKGRIDPLTTEPVANRKAKLSERFKLIQARQ